MTKARHRLNIAVCGLLASALNACTMQEGVVCEPCQCGAASVSLEAEQRFDEVLPDMTSALQVFGVAEESAIHVIIQLSEPPGHEKRLRVCDMSEEQWVAHWGDDWQRQRDVLVRRLTDLRFLANQLVGRAAYLKSAGETDKAVKILNAVKRLGAANQGPGVPKVCDIVGKAIENLAEKNLAAMHD